MGKGERRGRAGGGRRHHRRHHHHHNHHHNRHHHHGIHNHHHGIHHGIHHHRRHHRIGGRGRVRIIMAAALVPGTEKERRAYRIAVIMSILFCVMGFNIMLCGIFGISALLYVGITLLCLGAMFVFRAHILYKKLKMAEASVTSSQTAPATQIPTSEIGGQTGQNIATHAGYNPPTVITLQQIANSMPNVTAIGQTSAENGINNYNRPTIFTVYGSAQAHALSSSMPNVAAASNATSNFHPGYVMPQTGQPHIGIGMPTQFAGSSHQICTPPSYTQCGFQSIAVPAAGVGLPSTDDTTVQMEPPPPCYEDVVNVQNKATSDSNEE